MSRESTKMIIAAALVTITHPCVCVQQSDCVYYTRNLLYPVAVKISFNQRNLKSTNEPSHFGAQLFHTNNIGTESKLGLC